MWLKVSYCALLPSSRNKYSQEANFFAGISATSLYRVYFKLVQVNQQLCVIAHCLLFSIVVSQHTPMTAFQQHFLCTSVISKHQRKTWEGERDKYHICAFSLQLSVLHYAICHLISLCSGYLHCPHFCLAPFLSTIEHKKRRK